MEKRRITFNAKIKPVEKLNDEFLQCKVYVCALGKNRNLSFISKEAAESALYSLYNIPVIGHLYEDENGVLHMGGHDMVVEKSEDGTYTWKSLCVPYGVVPQQDDVHYEDVTEPNGDVKTYIVADCLLWIGRFPELAEAAYSDDWMFSQSMEINVLDYAPLEEDKNYTDILSYSYSALCLLGRSDDKEYNVEPCFPESHVAPINYEFEYDERFSTLMEEFKNDLSKYFCKYDGKEGEVNMENDTMTTGTCVPQTDEFEEAKEPAVRDGADVSTEAIPGDAEPVEGGLKDSEFVAEAQSAENEGAQADLAKYAQLFTYREILDALCEAFCNFKEFVTISDFDDEYAYVHRCGYGENDNWFEDTGRYGYTYDADNKRAAINTAFEPMFVCWLTAEEHKALEERRNAFEELKAYKEYREEKDRELALDAALEPFEDLAGNEEYEAIAANRYSYESVEALQNACYVVRGKFGLIPKSHRPSEPSVPIGVSHNTTMTSREKLHAIYGRK